MGPLPDGLASESYTLGERISNALLFARLESGSWQSLPVDITESLILMADTLSERLEYFIPSATCNHPLNNARALYFAGKCLGVPRFSELAVAIISERLNSILDIDGFLREGSSHYHFLVTRWLLEIQFTANEFNDKPVLNLIRHPISLAIKRCLFFLVESTSERFSLPLIGDVSPDCEPAWLIDLPYSSLSRGSIPGIKTLSRDLKGWASLWTSNSIAHTNATKDTFISEIYKFVSPNIISNYQSFTTQGWYRLDWRDWCLIWHAESGPKEAYASHAHEDFGSFSIYHRGREVVIDIGRPSYERLSQSGNYSVTHIAHNSISVQGLGPMLTHRDRMLPPRYRNAEVSVEARFELETVIIELTHKGYERLRFNGSNFCHKRVICLEADNLQITDLLSGDGRVNISLALHFADKLDSKSSLISLERSSSGLYILQDEIYCGSSDTFYGWRYPSYGERQPCSTHIISAIANLPTTIKHTMTIRG
jgi:hypothetical protein